MEKWVAFDHSRIVLSWFSWAHSSSASASLHRLALELSDPGAFEAGTLSRLAAKLVYAGSGARQIRVYLRANRSVARREHGVGLGQQLAGLLHIVFRRNASPEFYYIQRLFLDGRLARSDAYFEHRELMVLLRALCEKVDADLLADKLRFHEFCQQQELPTVPVWGVFRDGRMDAEYSSRLASVPAMDLFVKPAAEYRGIGVERWLYHADSKSYQNGIGPMPFAGFCEHLAAESAGRTLLVQPRVFEGLELRDLSRDAICNYRVVTGYDPERGPQIISATLRMPAGSTFLTDYQNDVFAAAVDLETGQLGCAELKDLHLGRHAVHPDTKAPIAGRRIKNWSEIAALALRAQQQCPWMPFVGWDIVDTRDGLRLLEANAYWGGNLSQMAGNRPLGETSFPAIYIAHLHKLRPDLERFLACQ